MFKLFVACLLLTVCFAATPTEIQTLQNLYQSTNGPYWYNDTNWNYGDPCTNQWWGVKCSAKGNVIQLVLEKNNLRGPLPPLSGLSMLQGLGLSFNLLSGNSSGAISTLVNLIVVDISHNLLSYSPPYLANMLTLDWINLSYNHFSGPIPSDFQYLPDVTMNIKGAYFQCPLPSWASAYYATCLQPTITSPTTIQAGEMFQVIGNQFFDADSIQMTFSNTLLHTTTCAYKSATLLYCGPIYTESLYPVTSPAQIVFDLTKSNSISVAVKPFMTKIHYYNCSAPAVASTTAGVYGASFNSYQCGGVLPSGPSCLGWFTQAIASTVNYGYTPASWVVIPPGGYAYGFSGPGFYYAMNSRYWSSNSSMVNIIQFQC